MLLAKIYFKENKLSSSSSSSYNQLTKPKKVIATLIFSATGNIGEPYLFFNSLWIKNKMGVSSSLVPIWKPAVPKEMFLRTIHGQIYVYDSIWGEGSTEFNFVNRQIQIQNHNFNVLYHGKRINDSLRVYEQFTMDYPFIWMLQTLIIPDIILQIKFKYMIRSKIYMTNLTFFVKKRGNIRFHWTYDLINEFNTHCRRPRIRYHNLSSERHRKLWSFSWDIHGSWFDNNWIELGTLVLIDLGSNEIHADIIIIGRINVFDENSLFDFAIQLTLLYVVAPDDCWEMYSTWNITKRNVESSKNIIHSKITEND